MLQDQDEKINVTGAPRGTENCRAKQLDGSRGYELVECIVERPLCDHILTFGQHILCRHPKCREIVEQTQEAAARRA